MAKKIILILFLILLLIIPTVLASTTEINVKTKSYHRLLVKVYKAGIEPPEQIKSFSPYKDTMYEGKVKVSLTSEEPRVNIKLDLVKDDKNVITQDFPDVKTGEPVFINLLPPDNITIYYESELIENATNATIENTIIENATNLTLIENQTNKTIVLNETVELIENKTPSNFSITGYATDFYQKNSKIIYYVLIAIGIIILIIVIIFIIRFILNKRPHQDYSYSHIRQRPHDNQGSLSEAERKLKEAQDEIERIKHKNEAIREAERKLQEDRIRLERLRRGF